MGREKNENELLRDWVIYKIISPSGRVYVGKASSFTERINHYRNLSCKNQVMLYNSLLKYGFEAHKINIIEVFKSDNAYASDREIFWISENMSNYSKFPKQRGMNLTDGGEGTLGRKATDNQILIIKEAALKRERNPNYIKFRGKHTGQALENIRAAQKKLRGKADYIPGNTGKTHTELTKEKMSLAKIGKHPPNKGVPMSEEAKRKLSNTNKGKPAHNKGIKLTLYQLENRRVIRELNKAKRKHLKIFSRFSFQRRIFKHQYIKYKVA